MARSSKGRGWHGDPEGHAKAGRKGGRASSKSRANNRSATITPERRSGSQNKRISSRM